MVKITVETLQSLFLNGLREWKRVRPGEINAEQEEIIKNYLDELAYCYDGCEEPIDPDGIVDNVYHSRWEIDGYKDEEDEAC